MGDTQQEPWRAWGRAVVAGTTTCSLTHPGLACDGESAQSFTQNVSVLDVLLYFIAYLSLLSYLLLP